MNDFSLVKGIIKRSEKHLYYYYTKYKGPLFYFILKKIRDPKDAEEIRQDVFMASIEGMRDFTFRSSLFTYLCAIAKHKIADYFRSRKFSLKFKEEFGDLEVILKKSIDPARVFEEGLVKERILLAMKNIKPVYGRMLSLKYVEGYSVSQSAAILSLSFKSAESILFRARKAFITAFGK